MKQLVCVLILSAFVLFLFAYYLIPSINEWAGKDPSKLNIIGMLSFIGIYPCAWLVAHPIAFIAESLFPNKEEMSLL